jgi:TetR/AcrR family transcriptional repressor of nem operon
MSIFFALTPKYGCAYCRVMPKPSHREKILQEGMKVVHAHGYAGASVRDIVQAAGVPQGSFTNHFRSKEVFGREVIDLYFVGTRQLIADTLRNDAIAPLERFGIFLDTNIDRLKQEDMRNGCLYGNFAAEASDHSELIRNRLVEIFVEIQASIAYCLQAAVTAGEIPADTDCEELAAFMLASLQGAQLLVKAERSVAAMERLKRVFFASLLQQAS